MSCIKTGAKVYFENYGMTVPADLFSVEDCIIIRWNNANPFYGTVEEGNADYKVDYCFNSELWWHRDDLGVTVVPRYTLSKI